MNACDLEAFLPNVLQARPSWYIRTLHTLHTVWATNLKSLREIGEILREGSCHPLGRGWMIGKRRRIRRPALVPVTEIEDRSVQCSYSNKSE